MLGGGIRVDLQRQKSFSTAKLRKDTKKRRRTYRNENAGVPGVRPKSA